MKVQVTINNVKIIEPSILNENEYNIHECEFEFVEEYNGLSKKAIFTNEAGADYIVSIVNDKCSIPSEVLKEKEFVKLGVYAYDVENEELVLRYSPKPTEFYVQEGSYKNAGGTPPTPSEIEQLQAQITHNRNDIEEIQDNINDINEQQAIQDETIQNNTNAIGIINETIGTINENIGDLQEGQIEQNINIQKNADDITEINQDINEIDSSINDINQNIDDLEQDLTNYSLITETGSQINLNINSSNFQMTAILKDKNGNVIHTSNVIDLPLETMVVGASYDNVTKEVVLTLQNGTTLRFSVADLVSGLVSETQLQTILANYYTKTEVDSLLSNLAERVSTNEEDIADIKEEQTTQNEDIEELQNKVEELETENENLRKALPQIKGEGTDITLENTSENKFVEFGLEGRTEQKQLTGKNLFVVADIKNVTGNANVKIQNKNLFDGQIELGSINPANGELQVNAGRARSKNFIKVKPNTTYTISVQSGQYRWVIGYTADKIGITDGNVDGQPSAISSFAVSIYSTTNTFTTTATTEYIKWYDTSSTDLTEKVQLEQGTTATSYVPHQEQNLPFTLGDIELNKIDTAQDYFYKENNKWYLHKEIGSKKSNFNWKRGADYNPDVYYSTEIDDYEISNNIPLCNYFQGIENVSSESIMVGKTNQIAFRADRNYIRLYVNTSLTAEQLNSLDLRLYYKLATPKNTEITDTTLINQLDAIKEAISYYEQTNISGSSDELSPIITAGAVGDLNLILDTMQSKIDLLEG